MSVAPIAQTNGEKDLGVFFTPSFIGIFQISFIRPILLLEL